MTIAELIAAYRAAVERLDAAVERLDEATKNALVAGYGHARTVAHEQACTDRMGALSAIFEFEPLTKRDAGELLHFIVDDPAAFETWLNVTDSKERATFFRRLPDVLLPAPAAVASPMG
jgi:hypothetical protein